MMYPFMTLNDDTEIMVRLRFISKHQTKNIVSNMPLAGFLLMNGKIFFSIQKKKLIDLMKLFIPWHI